jgi:hypothetical protein
MHQQDFLGERKEHIQPPFKYHIWLPPGWQARVKIDGHEDYMRTPLSVLTAQFPNSNPLHTIHPPISPCFLNPDYSIKYKEAVE